VIDNELEWIELNSRVSTEIVISFPPPWSRWYSNWNVSTDNSRFPAKFSGLLAL
jgi:hypothetical protein